MTMCPVCSATVEAGPAYSSYSGRFGGFPSGQGVRCRSCNTVLAVNASVTVALHILGLVALVTTTLFAPVIGIEAQLSISLFLVVGYFFLVTEYGPRLLKLRLPHPNENILSDDELFDFPDPTPEEIEEIRIMMGIAESPVGRRWSCPNCGEENGREFRICWNCQQEYREDVS